MKLGPPSEATQALTYESTSIVHHTEFFFFLPSQQFEKISLIILNLILIMEIRD